MKEHITLKQFKMSTKAVLFILLSALLFGIVFSSCSCLFANEITTLHIPPTICEPMLYGVTAEDFCQSKGVGTILEGKYISAYIDDDGCLILTLTNKALAEWKNTSTSLQVLQCVLGDDRDIGITIDYSKDFMDFMKDAHTCGYEISEDFSQIIESPEDNGWYFPFIVFACAEMQVFSGKTCKEIKVEHIEINTQGEIIETFVFP